jgi:NADH-quinone oxidoreductase subunit M
MSYVVIGIFSGSVDGMVGAIFQMISHGLISAGLFFAIGSIYNQTHTRNIADYSGLAGKVPFFSSIFIALTMANIGLPGTSGFVGEFLTTCGAFHYSFVLSVFMVCGVVLSAIYMLQLCRKIIFGSSNSLVVNEINLVDKISLCILLCFIGIIGLSPHLITNTLTILFKIK